MAPSNLTRNILIGMGLGIILGSIVHFLDLAEGNPWDVYLIDGLFDLGGQIFVLSLKLLVVPLVFVSLVCGASNLGAGSSMGRIGLKTIILYLFTTATAISIALIVASIVDPGVGINLPTTAEYVAKQGPSLK